MKTRLGKIAQLPKPIRDDLNHRLDNGKQGREILEWLNSLPETKDLIAQKFDNQPISPSNLSDWRHGGFLDWRADQLRETRIQRICETGDTLQQAETGDLFENFARVAVAEMVTDLDALQKLHGEKRAEHLHHLVQDLARLQNAYNRSRWADLAWTKHNGNSGTGACRAEALAKANLPVQIEASSDLLAPNSQLLTPSPTAPLVLDCAASQAGGDPDDSDPKPNGNGMYVLHFTNCNCDEPCPKCHASESAYPLADAIRDRCYKRKFGRNPCDRHGQQKFLINVACDCACDRCAEKSVDKTFVTNVTPACPAEDLAEAGRVALPCDLIIHQTERHDEISTAPTDATPPPTPSLPINPLPPIQLTDFSRRLALLKTMS